MKEWLPRAACMAFFLCALGACSHAAQPEPRCVQTHYKGCFNTTTGRMSAPLGAPATQTQPRKIDCAPILQGAKVIGKPLDAQSLTRLYESATKIETKNAVRGALNPIGLSHIARINADVLDCTASQMKGPYHV